MLRAVACRKCYAANGEAKVATSLWGGANTHTHTHIRQMVDEVRGDMSVACVCLAHSTYYMAGLEVQPGEDMGSTSYHQWMECLLCVCRLWCCATTMMRLWIMHGVLSRWLFGIRIHHHHHHPERRRRRARNANEVVEWEKYGIYVSECMRMR